MMRIRTGLFLVAVAAVLLLASGLLVGVFPTAVEPPKEVTTPPQVPEGTVYWVDLEFNWLHVFVDNQGRGSWQGAGGGIVAYGLPGNYTEHDITVWEQTLDEGYSWNLDGTCELKGYVKVYYERDDKGYPELLHRDLDRWPATGETLITFPCNQGSYGYLTLRPPTFFLKLALPGDAFVRYHFDFVGTLSFKSGTYTEVDSFDGGPVLCPQGSNC